MNTRITFRPVALTLFVFLVVSYLLCIVVGLVFGWGMVEVWAPLLPGFDWPLTGAGFVTGLLWLVGYALYGAALVVYPYNYFAGRPTT